MFRKTVVELIFLFGCDMYDLVLYHRKIHIIAVNAEFLVVYIRLFSALELESAYASAS